MRRRRRRASASGSIYQYSPTSDAIIDAAIKGDRRGGGPAIGDMLGTITLAEAAAGMHAAIDMLIDYTFGHRKIIRTSPNARRTSARSTTSPAARHAADDGHGTRITTATGTATSFRPLARLAVLQHGRRHHPCATSGRRPHPVEDLRIGLPVRCRRAAGEAARSRRRARFDGRR